MQWRISATSTPLLACVSCSIGTYREGNAEYKQGSHAPLSEQIEHYLGHERTPAELIVVKNILVSEICCLIFKIQRDFQLAYIFVFLGNIQLFKFD
jgi:hypothetical protein